jgi:hypothetical protein
LKFGGVDSRFEVWVFEISRYEVRCSRVDVRGSLFEIWVLGFVVRSECLGLGNLGLIGNLGFLGPSGFLENLGCTTFRFIRVLGICGF